jgi:crossover junction endodeoxyribonuclease RuvC
VPVVLGIDPGLERVGYGVVRIEGSRLTSVEHGLIKTPPGPTPGRLLQIHAEISALVARARPDRVGMERLFFAKNQTTAIEVAKACGAIQLALAQAGLDPVELSPPQVKLAVVGNGAAEKVQVGFMVTRLLGLEVPPRPDDVADALAVAIAVALGAG